MLNIIVNDENATQSANCQHEHQVVMSTGGISFDGLEVVNTIGEQVVCVDCFTILEQREASEEIPF